MDIQVRNIITREQAIRPTLKQLLKDLLKVTKKGIKMFKMTKKSIQWGEETLTLETGKIEVSIEQLEILSMAEELPMPVFGDQDYPEDIRLKYRFLDIRREELHNNLILRSLIIFITSSTVIKFGSALVPCVTWSILKPFGTIRK